MANRSLALSHSERIGVLYLTLLDHLSIIDSLVGHIESEHERLTAQMLMLEEDGIAVATRAYQRGKYLYLIHPMHNGKRQREYVGSDLGKIRTAESRVSNYQKFAALERELLNIEAGGIKLLNQLNRIANISQGGNK